MHPIWLVRARRWVQNPPSPGRIKFIAAIILLCLLLLIVERTFGWPEALSPNNLRRMR